MPAVEPGFFSRTASRATSAFVMRGGLPPFKAPKSGRIDSFLPRTPRARAAYAAVSASESERVAVRTGSEVSRGLRASA